MEQDNKEITRLEQQLREAALAAQFLEQDTGRLWVEFATQEINKIVNDITSDKFLKDHVGYVNALADLRAYKKMINKFRLACAPQRVAKINERIEQAKEDEK